MRHFLARSTSAILLALQVLSPTFVFSQQDASQERAQAPVQSTTQTGAGPQKASRPAESGEWKIADPLRIVSLDRPGTDSLSNQEPTIRVALATGARSATISTSGHLMKATDLATTLVAMDVARVRLEPRLLSPLPATDNADTYRIQIAGLASRADAEEKSRAVREATGEDSQVAYDTVTKTWGLLVGARHPQIEAEELRARLEDAGLDATLVPAGGASSSVNPSSTLGTQGTQTAPATRRL